MCILNYTLFLQRHYLYVKQSCSDLQTFPASSGHPVYANTCMYPVSMAITSNRKTIKRVEISGISGLSSCARNVLGFSRLSAHSCSSY